MSLAGGVADPPDYSFAFGSKAYSDRTLTLEIVAVDESSLSGSSGVSARERPHDDLVAESSPGSGCYSTPKSVNRRKRPRLNVHNGTAEDKGGEEEEEEEEEEGKEEKREGTPVLRVEEMPVSSVILAGKSPYFQKMFDNGWKESGVKDFKLRVNTEEVDAVKELLYFMYSNNFRSNDPLKLIAVLAVAEMYEVPAASDRCIALLQEIEMTQEIALMYLQNPFSEHLAQLLRPLKLSACSFFAKRYKDILKSNDELLRMPLSVIRAVFSSSQIAAPSEDYILKFLLQWVTLHYPDLARRKYVFDGALIGLVRFVHLSCLQLRNLLRTDLFDVGKYGGAIVFALLFKTDAAFSQLPSLRMPEWNYAPRCYVLKSLKVTHFKEPFYQSICYMDIKREDCQLMFPANRVSSEAFTVTGHQMSVKAGCHQQEGTGHALGVFVGIHNFSQPLTFRVEIAARRRPAGLFHTDFNAVATFTSGGQMIGAPHLIPWAQLVADDSNFFINDTLHLRVDVTLLPSQPHQPQ